MKYEFHVGDYVILNNGQERRTGYVKKYKGPVFSNDYCFVFQWDDGTQFEWSGHIEELPHNIVRIGQYDFTKKGKIETISNDPADWEDSFVLDKINELVEAVNRLEEKIDEMV